MKKKYFTPEMEELELDSPVVLDVVEGSSEETGLSNQEGGESL